MMTENVPAMRTTCFGKSNETVVRIIQETVEDFLDQFIRENTWAT